jgi:hypothetical protein
MKRCCLRAIAVVAAVLSAAGPPAPSRWCLGADSYRIKLGYFLPNDRKPVANYEQKIRLVMSIVGELYLQDLRAKGHATDGLRFEGSEETPTVKLIEGARKAAYYNNAPGYDADEQWRRLMPEIRSQLGDPRQQVLIVFTETYDDGPAEHLWPGVIARGAYNTASGGLAVFSSHILRDEFCALNVEEQRRLFFDQTPVPGRKAWGHRIDSPRCAFIEDGIGAVAHELGHALGLPHDRRQDAQDVMGNGFRNLRWNFAPSPAKRVAFSEENARLLMSSRYLAKDLDLTDNQPPTVRAEPPARDRSGWNLTVHANDDKGLKAIVIVDRKAGSVVAGRALKGKSQQIRQRIPDSAASSPLQIIVSDSGGNQSRGTNPKTRAD